ncbi:hypothetical protein ACU635_20885 [[Actinomadura] parvosata]|uniref:hypothetical protein n=1 Tax=[Actinomadura] parvosata TaxID=1955412 RepID=UPI00406C8908
MAIVEADGRLPAVDAATGEKAFLALGPATEGRLIGSAASGIMIAMLSPWSA